METRVLLVDDEEEFISALAERLNLRGIAASTCSSGAEALGMIGLDPPDVVVLDLMMPGIGGREIFSVLREKYPRIGVVFLTGQGCLPPGDEILKEGFCDYLVKPVNIDELIGKLRAAAARRVDPG